LVLVTVKVLSSTLLSSNSIARPLQRLNIDDARAPAPHERGKRVMTTSSKEFGALEEWKMANG
jgi:hypothetical protein